MLSAGDFSSTFVFDTRTDMFGTRIATGDSKGKLTIYEVEPKKKPEVKAVVDA